MDYLALCNRLDQECGDKGSGITTVVGQVGKMKRIVDWVNSAWNDIQTAHRDWGWMRTSASFPTVNATSVYPLGTGAGTVGVLAANHGMWAQDTFRNYNTVAGTNSEIFFGEPIKYDTWRDRYLYGALRNTRTRPIELAIAPDKSICLGPVPNGDYTIIGDYFTAPVDLVNGTDIPGLPVQFHMAIVYRAMMFYGGYESAPEVYDRGAVEFDKIMARLDADRLPTITWQGALA